MPMMSFIEKFRDEFEAHLSGTCPFAHKHELAFA
jgi:hypothetical protein